MPNSNLFSLIFRIHEILPLIYHFNKILEFKMKIRSPYFTILFSSLIIFFFIVFVSPKIC